MLLSSRFYALGAILNRTQQNVAKKIKKRYDYTMNILRFIGTTVAVSAALFIFYLFWRFFLTYFYTRSAKKRKSAAKEKTCRHFVTYKEKRRECKENPALEVNNEKEFAVRV